MNLHGLKVEISKFLEGEHCYQSGDSIILSQKAYNKLIELMSDTAFKSQFQNQPAPPPKPKPPSSLDIAALMKMTPAEFAELLELLEPLQKAKPYTATQALADIQAAKKVNKKVEFSRPERSSDWEMMVVLKAIVVGLLLQPGAGQFILTPDLILDVDKGFKLKIERFPYDDTIRVSLE